MKQINYLMLLLTSIVVSLLTCGCESNGDEPSPPDPSYAFREVVYPEEPYFLTRYYYYKHKLDIPGDWNYLALSVCPGAYCQDVLVPIRSEGSTIEGRCDISHLRSARPFKSLRDVFLSIEYRKDGKEVVLNLEDNDVMAVACDDLMTIEWRDDNTYTIVVSGMQDWSHEYTDIRIWLEVRPTNIGRHVMPEWSVDVDNVEGYQYDEQIALHIMPGCFIEGVGIPYYDMYPIYYYRRPCT